jgi:hypothetical protein
MVRVLDLTRGFLAGSQVAERRRERKRGEQRDIRLEAQEERAQRTEERQITAFETAQEQVAIDRARQEKADAEAAEDREIKKVQTQYNIAFKNKNFRAADELRFQLGELTGIYTGGDFEELNTLIIDHNEAEKAGDLERAADIEDYMTEVLQVSKEEAARTLGLTSVVEQEVAERETEQEVVREEALFGIKQKQAEQLRKEKKELIETGLEGREDFTDSEKNLISLVGQKILPANLLNTLVQQKGVTFRTGLVGTGELEGQRVTKVFDREGNVALDEEGNEMQFAEAGREEIEETPLKKADRLIKVLNANATSAFPFLDKATERNIGQQISELFTGQPTQAPVKRPNWLADKSAEEIKFYDDLVQDNPGVEISEQEYEDSLDTLQKAQKKEEEAKAPSIVESVKKIFGKKPDRTKPPLEKKFGTITPFTLSAGESPEEEIKFTPATLEGLNAEEQKLLKKVLRDFRGTEQASKPKPIKKAKIKKKERDEIRDLLKRLLKDARGIITPFTLSTGEAPVEKQFEFTPATLEGLDAEEQKLLKKILKDAREIPIRGPE